MRAVSQLERLGQTLWVDGCLLIEFQMYGCEMVSPFTNGLADYIIITFSIRVCLPFVSLFLIETCLQDFHCLSWYLWYPKSIL